MVADGDLAGRLCDLKSDSSLEPLPLLIQERNERDRSSADLGRYLCNAIELNLRLRIQNVEALERSKAIDLLPWR
jgi:hypothetical protein